MAQCFCGSQNKFSNCCQPIIEGNIKAPTAESLMRSRYSAYVVNNPEYLVDTVAQKTRADHKLSDIEEWANQANWLGLTVVKAQEQENTATVEFFAKYQIEGKVESLHETSEFVKENDQWFYLDGDAHIHSEKVGRNDDCPCGSGKKYKKCCMV